MAEVWSSAPDEVDRVQAETAATASGVLEAEGGGRVVGAAGRRRQVQTGFKVDRFLTVT